MVTKKKTRDVGIYRLDDGRWSLRVTSRVDGKKVYKKKVLPADTPIARVREELEALRRTLAAPPPPPRLTVQDYAKQWLEDKAARCAPSTAEILLQIVADHILPQLGHLSIDEVRREHVDRWVQAAERARRPDGELYAHETQMGWWRKLRALLRDAQADGHLAVDPCYRVKPPRRLTGWRHERRTITADELGALLAAVQKNSPERYAEVLVLAFTGLRSGELYALQWDDIGAGVLEIRRAQWRGIVGATKTGDPRRVPLVGEVQEALRAHRLRLVEDQHPGLASGLVFPSDTGGYRPNSALQKVFATARREAGIVSRVTPRVLRRTFNTLLALDKVDRLVLRSMMGHCDEQMTERYAGVPDEQKQQAVASLVRVVALAGGPRGS